jgi:hypothetical protein
MRVHGYVNSVESDHVTFNKVLDDHILKPGLYLHDLQPSVPTVPQFLRQ